MPAPATGTKRTRGTGSVRQRRRGVWQIRWEEVGRSRTETVHGTKTEAEAVLAERLAEARRLKAVGLYSTDPRLTVGEWLRIWLDHTAKQSVRATTYEGYERIVERELVPGLGDIELRRLGVAEVQTYVNERSGTPHWARFQRSVLRSALSEAERQGLVPRNVAKLVRMPVPPRKEREPLTQEQAKVFLSAIEGDRLEALYKLAMGTGMRQGELLGLTWDAVDLDEGVLTVSRALKHTKEHGYFLDEPKTAKSRRTLWLVEPLREALRAHRHRQKFERAMAGSGWLGDDWNLVFPRADGHPYDGLSVTKRFQRKLAQAGLPRLRFHDLRHGAATYLLSADVPMRVIMEQLGHSQMATTADLYSHVLPEVQRDASERIGEALFG